MPELEVKWRNGPIDWLRVAVWGGIFFGSLLFWGVVIYGIVSWVRTW